MDVERQNAVMKRTGFAGKMVSVPATQGTWPDFWGTGHLEVSA